MAWQDLEQQYVKENNKNDRSNYLKDIIAGLSIANNNDPKTLLGYGIGRLLSNYVNRGLERRQQDKNQKAYDEWINGGPQATPQQEQLMPLMQGTPFAGNNNQNNYNFANDIANQMTGGRPNYMQNAIDNATGHKQGENYFPMPQTNNYVVGGNNDGMIEQGNIDLSSRPVVRNKDGSVSTVLSTSVNIDGNEVLLPLVSDDGNILTPEQAVEQYKRTGKHLGIFKDVDSANAYAEKLHQDQEKRYTNQPQNIKQTAQDIARQMWGGANLSSEEAFANAYRIARANGSTETQALDFARKTAGQQQARRIQALSDEFLAKGVGLDGVINPYGVQVLSRLAQEDPKQTNVLGNMYQTPLGATKYAQDIAKMMQSSDLQLRNATEMANLTHQLKQISADADVQRKIQLMDATQQRQFDNAYKAGYLGALLEGKSPEVADAYGKLHAFQSLGGISGGGRSGGGNGGAGRNGGGNNGDWSKDSYKNYIDRKKNFLDAGESLPEGGRNPYENDLFMAALRYAGEMDTNDPASMNFWKDYYMTVKGWTEDQFNQYVEDYSNRAQNQQNTIDKNRRLQVNHRGRGLEDEESSAPQSTKENEAIDSYYNPESHAVEDATGISYEDGGQDEEGEDIRQKESEKEHDNPWTTPRSKKKR